MDFILFFAGFGEGYPLLTQGYVYDSVMVSEAASAYVIDSLMCCVQNIDRSAVTGVFDYWLLKN